jgi:hypothetical protein
LIYWSKCRNDILPQWGNQRIDRLLPEHIEDVYAEMLTAGHAPGHVRKVHAVLSSALAEQVRKGNLARNPAPLVQAPALPQRERSALTAAQARIVLAAAASRRNAARWSIGPMTYALREARHTALGTLPAQTAAHACGNDLDARLVAGRATRSGSRVTPRSEPRRCVRAVLTMDSTHNYVNQARRSGV